MENNDDKNGADGGALCTAAPSVNDESKICEDINDAALLKMQHDGEIAIMIRSFLSVLLVSGSNLRNFTLLCPSWINWSSASSNFADCFCCLLF